MVLECSLRLSGGMGTAAHSNLALKMMDTLSGVLWEGKEQRAFFMRSQGNLSRREFAALSGGLGLLIYH